MVEHFTCNEKVLGSIPKGGLVFSYLCKYENNIELFVIKIYQKNDKRNHGWHGNFYKHRHNISIFTQETHNIIEVIPVNISN